MAVVKADAYGHGAARVAAALTDADGYAVARLGEALALRAAGVTRPILLLEGVFSAEELAQALAARLDLAVHDLSQVEMLEQVGVTGEGAEPSRPVVWLKVDTGMNRLGFRPEQALAARARMLACRVAPRELRLMTHLARADETDAAPTALQTARFEALVAEWTAVAGARPAVSIGNSAGTLRGGTAAGSTQGDWIRPGLALYGASPFEACSAADLGLRPVMTLETAVIALREVPTGEGVGYGATWRASRPSRIAVLAAGYADGLPRSLAGGSPIAFAGGLAPIVGRISMDMIAVDATDLPRLRRGDRAVLWGEGLPVEGVAARAGTLAYELLCAVSPRVPRAYLERA